MPNLMQRGMSWLHGKLDKADGIKVTYRRGAQSILNLSAVVARTEFNSGNAEGTTVVSNVRDYLIMVADLVLSGSPIKPQAGDKIEEVIGGATYTYTVLSLDNSEISRDSDTYHEKHRIHTKLTGSAT